ncbi:helix-turn-helix domain containing protein [Ureaplasma sp. ES3154-GEN]|uniref:helix-turn-helix domain-containing protein n=1 Tax=Ureaplasma sp. ES3154-GEN TaxID=2984844 RepID=UPI0021E8C5E4|nr:helix-turn-helix domain-containing protein [Ureaplasma sp. ES3154-GEN]MCV3743365.1 helix-turn-helix domain containing protein [Ureaplasma sp. ES3154-GEN]
MTRKFQKQEVLKRYFAKEMSVKQLAEIYKITPTTIYKWIKQFQNSEIKDETICKNIVHNEKIAAIIYFRNHYVSIDAVCAKFNITPKIFILWHDEFIADCKNKQYIKHFKITNDN